VLDSVDQQLTHEPNVETRNRKLMRANPVAPWELRVGDIRVYYDVGEDVVVVVAIGVKRRNQVYIGGKAVNL
jgi:mRNA-degrading endonuclease RelE of RelBE toxin-antitoxin system